MVPKSLEETFIPTIEFIGLEDMTHLCAGGESPTLKSHQAAVQRFFADKAMGEASRERMEKTVSRCKQKVGELLDVSPNSIAFVSTSSEGINLLAYDLKWCSRDNVVLCDVEFSSDVLPWTRLKAQGVEVHIVSNQDWFVSLSDLQQAIKEHCCGGPVRLIATIEDPAVLVKILTHLGLPTKAPPRAPAKAGPLFQTA